MLPEFPDYNDRELRRNYTRTNAYEEKGWFKTPDERITLPSDFTTQLVQQTHQSTHLGEKKIQDLLRRVHFKVFDLKSKTAEAISPCPTCHLMSAKRGVTRTGHWENRTQPGASREINFTEVKPGLYGYKWLLYKYQGYFSGWTEAFPTKYEMVAIAVRKLLEEIIPRYGLAVLLSSDMGLHSSLR